jgi:hypothetical protein
VVRRAAGVVHGGAGVVRGGAGVVHGGAGVVHGGAGVVPATARIDRAGSATVLPRVVELVHDACPLGPAGPRLRLVE